MLRNFQDQMTPAGLAPKTVKNRMLNVSFFLKRMGIKNKVQWSELPAVEEKPVKAFSTDELRKLLSQCNEEEHGTF